jgi:RNA polymerase sigma-70 factor (ECF subfamily)
VATEPIHYGEAALIAAIKHRDEAAFVALVTRFQGPLLRLARVYARSPAVAEEIVQDTWLGVLQGIDRFEGRSSFKTWLFQILVNRARTRATREGRMLPFSAFEDPSSESGESSVPADRFFGDDHPEWPHHWAVPPKAWGAAPEEQLLRQETLELVERAIAALPPSQREVITLRDVQGWTSEEVCNVLEITETNQRVLLHRARGRVRAALEHYFDRRAGG